MSTQTTSWVCKCGTENRLCHATCLSCSAPMPKKIKKKVFREELMIQEKLIEAEVVNKHYFVWEDIFRGLYFHRKDILKIKGLYVMAFLALVYCAQLEGHNTNIVEIIEAFYYKLFGNVKVIAIDIWDGVFGNLKDLLFQEFVLGVFENLKEIVLEIIDNTKERFREIVELIENIKKIFS